MPISDECLASHVKDGTYDSLVSQIQDLGAAAFTNATYNEDFFHKTNRSGFTYVDKDNKEYQTSIFVTPWGVPFIRLRGVITLAQMLK